MPFTFLEHTADIKFRASGKTIDEVFRACTRALSVCIAGDNKIKRAKKKKIFIEASDNEGLLYKFLDELIYLLDAEGFAAADANISIKDCRLKAIVYGDNASNYKNLSHVKAATYAEMKVKHLKDKSWEAVVVMDV